MWEKYEYRRGHERGKYKVSSEKKIEDMSFEELVGYATREIHSALLEGGARNMKATIHMWMDQAIYWDGIQRKKGKNK